jgi:hypothetical protein
VKTEPHNKGMKLSKPEYLQCDGRGRPSSIEAGFAAYAQCWTDDNGMGVECRGGNGCAA